MRIIAEKFANLSDNSVVGVRAPYLRVGGNNQFTMMEEQAFLYDSTITAALNNPPLWPYTMYFRMPHRCHGNLQHCPTRSVLYTIWVTSFLIGICKCDDKNVSNDALKIARRLGNGDERVGSSRGPAERRVPARLRHGGLLQQHSDR